ncbi:MAG: conjugal transfer protein TraX, partial [Defluviitaleaceae bacterium]|nr:conjugal transfer protein TraX [Defluviitaleaceae bacterium]
MFQLDAYKLKWIAIIGMILNHMVFAWQAILPMPLMFVLYAPGGLTFPILAYFVVEGYRHTSNLGRYILRLLIFGVISIPFHFLVFGSFGLNILFTIALSLLALLMYDKIKIRFLFWLAFVVLIVASAIFMFDWFIIGPIVVLLYHIIPNENARRIVPPIVAGVFMLGLTLFSMAGLALMQATPGMEADAAALIASFGDMELMTAALTFIIGCFTAAFLLKGFNGERG